MKLIVGLGNPGKKYEKTRHNSGFIAIDYYANKNKLLFKNKMNGLYAEAQINNNKFIILKPQNFMNLSGDVVRKYYDYYNLSLNDVIVIYDDVDFNIGTFKIKRGGSSAGHNGIKDIIDKLGTEDVNRIRIGTSKSNISMINYVLGKFSKDDIDRINLILPEIADAIEDFANNTSIDDLMAKYNKKE